MSWPYSHLFLLYAQSCCATASRSKAVDQVLMLHQGRDITDLILETPWGTVSSQGLNGMDSVSVSLPLGAGPVSCGGEPAPVGALV